MSESTGLRALVEAQTQALESQLAEIKHLLRRMNVRYKWKLKWATSRRAWRNRPHEREFIEFRRRYLEHTFHPSNQYRDPTAR